MIKTQMDQNNPWRVNQTVKVKKTYRLMFFKSTNPLTCPLRQEPQ